MKEVIKLFFILIIFCCFVICILGLVEGYNDSKVIGGIRECDSPTKGSRLIPTYRLGCYLGEPVDK